MKAVAHSYFWWIGLDKDIETLAKSCGECQAVKSNPAAARLHPWVWPDEPWTRIHVDYADHIFLTFKTNRQLQSRLAGFEANWPASKPAGGCESGLNIYTIHTST